MAVKKTTMATGKPSLPKVRHIVVVPAPLYGKPSLPKVPVCIEKKIFDARTVKFNVCTVKLGASVVSN